MIVLLVVGYPSRLFAGSGVFLAGLGAGLIIAIYDSVGYNPTAYMGAELKNPGRVMPRSIIYSIMAIMALYLALQVGVVGVLPWQEIVKSTSVASLVVTHNWSHIAAEVVTGFSLVAAFASVFTGLLGGSRVPYHAAQDGTFFRISGSPAPQVRAPALRPAGDGMVCAIGMLVIGMLVAVSVLKQSVAQVVAGVVAFLIRARVNRAWRFGPLKIREQFLDQQRARQTEPAQLARDSVSA